MKSDWSKRLKDVCRFYTLLDQLDVKCGGKRLLHDCHGRMKWPARGVYFFFELGELRTNSEAGRRVVRVGTHALTGGSRTTLWNRLSQHQGTIKDGGGNHRGSIFHLHVGAALINRDAWTQTIALSWANGSSANADVRQVELPLERAVSQYIRQMPSLWLKVDDAPGPDGQRGVIESNAIVLLSNFNSPDTPVDPPSSNWLGHWADREAIRFSGLWNVNHVNGIFNPVFSIYLRSWSAKAVDRL